MNIVHHRKASRFVRAGLAAAVFGCASQAFAATIFSQDFSGELASGSDPSTGYTLVPPGTSTVPPDYRVISNPGTDFSNGYESFTDHTGTTPSAMLFFDGQQGLTIWSGSAVLAAGSYTFSFWGRSGSASTPPIIQAQVNSANVGTALTTTDGAWTQFTYQFMASGATTFRLYDTVSDSFGNDAAIDDILLVSQAVTPPSNGVPEPGIVGLIGLGAVAAVARRSRRFSTR